MDRMICVVASALLFASVATGEQQIAKRPSLERSKVIYKEWAKGVRESTEFAKNLKNKEQLDRDIWLAASLKSKQERLCARSRMDAHQFFLMTKEGFAAKWPTDRPADRVLVDPIVSKAVFEDDLRAWTIEHMNADNVDSKDTYAIKQAYDKAIKSAPVRACGKVLDDGSKCKRNVVGSRGSLCFEHKN